MTWKGNLYRERKIERQKRGGRKKDKSVRKAWEQITWNTRDAGTRLSNIACTHILSDSSLPCLPLPLLILPHIHTCLGNKKCMTNFSQRKMLLNFFFGVFEKLSKYLKLMFWRERKVERRSRWGSYSPWACIDWECVCWCVCVWGFLRWLQISV